MSISVEQTKVSCNLIFLYVLVKDCQNILKIKCWPLAFIPYIKHFSKTKRDLELVSLSPFLHEFWRKRFLMLYSLNWVNFIVLWLPLLFKILGNLFIEIVIQFLKSWILNFTLKFLIKWFSQTDKKTRTKNQLGCC